MGTGGTGGVVVNIRTSWVLDDRVSDGVDVVDLGYVWVRFDLDGTSDVFESEPGERGKGCAGGRPGVLLNRHVTSYEREIFEACQRLQAQLLDDERVADVRQAAELSQTGRGEVPIIERHAAADDRTSQRGLCCRFGVAADGPRSGTGT